MSTVRRVMLETLGVAARHIPPAPTGRERLVVMRPDHIGDLLLTTPALRALRQARPGAEIVALVGPWSAQVLESNPDVDRILTYRFPWFDRRSLPSIPDRYAAAAALGTRLRAIAPTTVYVARPDHWWGALAAALGGVDQRTGYGIAECAPFLTDQLPPPGCEHVSLTSLRLLTGQRSARGAAPGRPPLRLDTTDDARSTAAHLRRGLIAPGRPYAVLHPGASSATKRWPARRWAEVADRLAASGMSVLLTAGPGERLLLDEIRASAARSHALAPELASIGALGALLEGARIALGVDSAPMHIAAAVDTPSIRLFGPGDEALFGPWGDRSRHRVIRAVGTSPDPAWAAGEGRAPHPSMLAIQTEEVLAEIDSMLATHS